MELSVLHSPRAGRGLIDPRMTAAPAMPAADGAADAVYLDVEVAPPAGLENYTDARVCAVGNAAGPVIVVLGGISGNRMVCRRPGGGAGWWPGLVGSGRAVDPAAHLVVGLDFAADRTGRQAPSTADQARFLQAALQAIGTNRADVIIGASYGGMVALAFAELFPDEVGKLVVISGGAEPHPAATAARELQRRVVALGLQSGSGDEALAIARGMAMLTYRTADEFADRFTGGIDQPGSLTASAPGGYLRRRGRDFLNVMSPERFLSLSASIDRHLVDPARIGCPVLLVGATSDQLVPQSQMQALAAALAGRTELHLRPCLYGHDMFLKEAEAIGRLVEPFLDS